MTTRRWVVGAIGLGTLAGLTLLLGRRTPSPRPESAEVVWAFEPPRRGAIAASPLAAGDRVYVAAVHGNVFRSGSAVYCLDAATGKPVWQFDDGGKMQHTFSTPCLADGRLYIGEGMHANFTCKLYCLDAATGAKLWDFTADGHVESSPCVAGGRVYFGAGEDGVYCLDAVEGKRLWRFAGPYHVDSSPAVAGGRVFAGSGVSRTNRTTEAWCLDAADGKVVWRYPTDLPVWGSPAVSGDRVVFGLGNGRLLTGPAPPEKAAGAVVCLSASTGHQLWRFDADDAVMGRACVDGGRVHVGSRGGTVYSLDLATGALRWKHAAGSPVVASPAAVGRRLYVAASGGRVSCLDAAGGAIHWTHDVAGPSRAEPIVLASPAVGPGGSILVGTELRNATGGSAVLFQLRDRGRGADR